MTAPEQGTGVMVDAEPPRRVSTALVAGAVVLAFLIACPCAIAAIFAGRRFVADSRVEYTRWAGASHRVAWSGDGRYGVAQVIDEEGAPEVVSWERQTGRARTAAGYRLAGVERFGAVAWLVPFDRRELAEHLDAEWGGVLVPAGGAFDSVPESVHAWQLGVEEPVAVVSGEPAWTRWPGPAEWSVIAVIDPARGAYPARLTVESSKGPAGGTLVPLPEDLATFDPVGWSASGRYFAIAEMIPSEGAAPQGSFTRRVLVVDASQAAVVTTAAQRVSPDHGPAPVWDEARDLLLWVDAAEPGTSTEAGTATSVEPAVMALVPGGAARPVAGSDDTHLAGLGDVRAVRIHLSDPEGLVLESAGALVRRSVSGGCVVTSLPPGTASPPVYHREGGWLVLASETDASAASSRDVLLHLEPGARDWKVVWAGGWRSEEW